MRKSPKQAADIGINVPERRQWIREASITELHQFLHINADSTYGPKDHDLAKVALDIRISEESVTQSNRLHDSVTDLISIAEAQKILAVKLDRQTGKLIRLTWALLLLTFALLVGEWFRYIVLHKDASTEQKGGRIASQTNVVSPVLTNR